MTSKLVVAITVSLMFLIGCAEDKYLNTRSLSHPSTKHTEVRNCTYDCNPSPQCMPVVDDKGNTTLNCTTVYDTCAGHRKIEITTEDWMQRSEHGFNTWTKKYEAAGECL